MNFCQRSYQPMLHYVYTETIKHRGEISLHKHFKQRMPLLFGKWIDDMFQFFKGLIIQGVSFIPYLVSSGERPEDRAVKFKFKKKS